MVASKHLDRSSYLVAVIGGIGAGKSTICKLFEQLGAQVIDCDQIARNVLECPIIQQKIAEAFGECIILTNELIEIIDRKKLAQLVFSDYAALLKLEQIVLPEVNRIVTKKINQLEASGDPNSPLPKQVPLIILDIPVLEKSPFRHRVDEIVFIEASYSDRLARVQKNRGWTERDLGNREHAQIPLEWKRRIADQTVYNHDQTSETYLRFICQQLIANWIKEIELKIE